MATRYTKNGHISTFTWFTIAISLNCVDTIEDIEHNEVIVNVFLSFKFQNGS